MIAGAVAAMMMENCLFVVADKLSVTCTVKIFVPVVVGVPLNVPSPASKMLGTEPTVIVHE